MAYDRVGVVRRIYDGWGRGDFHTGAELFDPHVICVLRPEFPDAGFYVGPKAIADYMRYLFGSWSDLTIAGEEFVAAGDSVVAQVLQRGVGLSSGIVTDLRYFQVWTFRGDAVVRIESIRERADAFAAVGLEA